MKQLKNISIGISAYNEGKNIKKLLDEILNQEKNRWRLSEILIYCDGCSDNTINQAQTVKNSLIKIIDGKKRMGKTYRLKQMFEQFSGEILIMFDGDIELGDKNVVTNLIKPFRNKNVMLVGGNSKPFTPRTFFERSVYSTFSVFYDSRLKINGGNNIFGCTGSVLATRGNFAKSLNLPDLINEDAYIYLKCLSRGFQFKYVDKAIVYYKLPTNLKDYLRQLFRSDPRAVTEELETYFGQLVESEFNRPPKFYIRAVAKALLKNPTGASFIAIVNVLCKPFIKKISKNYKLTWFTAISTH
ncbi:MAG: glycosyltransferase [Candidatus Curtissbacteria bacterium]|nr:glycosyltransferase [Candidatus Curtissbacteria bacterium]